MAHRLLLADDSVTIQKVIELTFAEEGVEVISVSDGVQAIEKLGTDRFDVVLADVGMPGKDGFEVASFVRSQPGLSGLPVVLLTGAFDPLDDDRVTEVGAAAVLVKPFEPQMVIAKVRELLGKPRPVASERPSGAQAPAIAPPVVAASHASADDYFDRLDKAFATLNPTLEPREIARPVAPQASAGQTPVPTAQPEVPAPVEGRDSSSAGSYAGQGVSPAASGLADTFSTLLAVEQGELPPSALLPPRTGEDEMVDRIARRVVEQLSDRAVRDLAADIVSRTAERLVREEIERIKTGA